MAILPVVVFLAMLSFYGYHWVQYSQRTLTQQCSVQVDEMSRSMELQKGVELTFLAVDYNSGTEKVSYLFPVNPFVKKEVLLTNRQVSVDRICLRSNTEYPEKLFYSYALDYWQDGTWVTIRQRGSGESPAICVNAGAGNMEYEYAFDAGVLTQPGKYRLYICGLAQCEFEIS